MQERALAARRSELTALAEARGVDWQTALQSFDEGEDVLVISGLATLLQLDVSRVLNTTASLEEVDRDCRELAAGLTADLEMRRADAERQFRNLPYDIRVKMAAQLDEAASALREA
jgi:hypothetical protein